MGYIRWWFDKYVRSDPNVCFPLFGLSLILVFGYTIFGATVTVITAVVVFTPWLIMLYIVLSDAWKKSYAEYVRTRNR